MHARGRLTPDTDPDTLALALLAALQGGLLLTQIERDTKPLEAALDAMLVCGWLRAAMDRPGRRQGPASLPVGSGAAGRGGPRLTGVGREPFEGCVSDLAPAVVDRQRVAAAFELLEFGDRRRIAVLLQRRACRHVRDGVVLLAGDQQQRPTGFVARSPPSPPNARRSWPPPPETAGVQATGSTTASNSCSDSSSVSSLPNPKRNCLAVSDTDLCRLAGFPSAGERGSQLRQRQGQHALDLRWVDRHRRDREILAQQLLGQQSAE